MSKFFKYVMILFCVNTFAQKTYTFDYYTVYEYKESEDDSIRLVRYNFANSEDSNTIIHLNQYNDGRVFSDLYDIDNECVYRFEIKNGTNIDDIAFDSIFKKPVYYKYILKSLKEKAQDKYDVLYQKEDNKNKIVLIRYKNKRKKKKISEIHYIMEPYPFVKNQFYSSDLMFAYKFDIAQVKTDEVIVESYVIDAKTNKKINIWKLKTIQPFDFQITIPESED